MPDTFFYTFPEKNIFKAREVLEADFDIDAEEYKDANLYVDLDPVRVNKFSDYKNGIKKSLKISGNGKLEALTDDYKKILFSGFKGVGKTIELRRLQDELNHPERYFSILVELEKEVEIETFVFEDFFVLMIIKLIQEIGKLEDIQVSKELDEIVKDWLRETEIETEVKRQFKAETGADAEAGFSLLTFFKTKFSIKAALSAEHAVSEKIREKVKKNPMLLINRFNLALDEIRTEIHRVGRLGKDILFIIDGSEKINFEIYKHLFELDRHIIMGLNANVITAIPIHAQYMASHNDTSEHFTSHILPVAKINEKSVAALREIVTRRIDEETFFASSDVLDYFVEMSGGMVRQLNSLIHFSLLYMEGERLTLPEAKEMVHEFGRRMSERLTREQREILHEVKHKKREIYPAEQNEGLLVFNLFLLKYNGTCEINPVLQEFI
ncbi:MAG: hypothetical protein AAF518_03750 [Spirochaetota bacterium]